MLNAAIGSYYYLRIVVMMYLTPAKETVEVRGGWPVSVSVAVCRPDGRVRLILDTRRRDGPRGRPLGHSTSGPRETPGRTARRGG